MTAVTITFEGPPASGKTLLLEKFRMLLNEAGFGTLAFEETHKLVVNLGEDALDQLITIQVIK